jgi:hypothetical protein
MTRRSRKGAAGFFNPLGLDGYRNADHQHVLWDFGQSFV